MRKLWHKIMLRVGPSAAFFLIKFLQITMRIEEVNGEGARGVWSRGENVIGAFWHGRLLMTPLVYGGGGLKILTSRHRDGELITRTVRHFGLETVFGVPAREGELRGLRGWPGPCRRDMMWPLPRMVHEGRVTRFSQG
jgi:lysophospholipid acyltransferase (LPLAT)-like uncharacterized protein